MDYGAFIKENPQLIGQAMGAMGGGQKQEQQPASRDAGPGVEPVRQQIDTGDQGYDGFKNVVKTVATFYAGGAGGAAIGQNVASTAQGGNSQQASAQNYQTTAQNTQQQPWLQKWAGGYSGG